MGYVDTSVTVFEDAGVAQLTVAISVPPQGDPIETSFFLLVSTNDGTAAGLSSCLEFDLHTHTHLSATESLTSYIPYNAQISRRIILYVCLRLHRELISVSSL